MDLIALNKFVEKFDRENGDFLCERDYMGNLTGWLIYPTGARRERNPIGCACPPPANAFERAKAIQNYWQQRLDLVVEEFQILKQQLTARAKVSINSSYSSIPPSQEELTKLKELQAKVKACQGKLMEAKKAFDDNMPEKVQERRKISEQNRQQNQRVLSELQKIEV